MARKKKTDKPFDGGIDVKRAVDALTEIEDEYSISPDETLDILKQSFEKAYKIIVNDNAKNAEDMRVEADLDIEDGYLTMAEIKDVVAEVQDDFLEIELEDALEINAEAKVGEQVRIPVDLTQLDKNFIHKVINFFMQKMKEEAKLAIKNSYSSKVGHIITGEVENVEYNTVSINFGKASGVLFKRDMLKDERFKIGQKVKVFLKMVDERKKNGILVITRSDENFLRCLFAENIQEVADGIISIKGVAREAGVRSKVAVDTTNPDIDPAGSCIGPDGSRINSLRDEINKERIDIVRYSSVLPIYVFEALRPATVIGVAIDEENHRITAVVKNNESKVAIGKGGINVRLASRLVGYSIDIKELDEAMNQKLVYQSLDDIRHALALSKLDEAELALEKPEIVDEYDEEEDIVISQPMAAEAETTVVPAALPDAAPVAEAPAPVRKTVEAVEHIEIKAKPKVSLADLEAQIESEKKKRGTAPARKKRKYGQEEEVEEEAPKKAPTPSVPTMPIYSEEELRQIEAEEAEEGHHYDYDDYDDYDDKY